MHLVVCSRVQCRWYVVAALSVFGGGQSAPSAGVLSLAFFTTTEKSKYENQQTRHERVALKKLETAKVESL